VDNTPSKLVSYDLISRFNHWIVAVVMIGMLIFGLYLHDLPPGPAKGQLIAPHKAIGVLVLIFGLWRVGYRLIQGFLEDASEMPKWQETIAKVIHLILIIGVIIMPLSGIVGSYFGGKSIEVFNLFTIPAGGKVEFLSELGHVVHGAFGRLMIFAVILHIAGALKHHFIDRDTTLTRMLRSK
jgi:cytochrome b561